MIFTEKLKSICKKTGVSQEQLSEKLGISKQVVIKGQTNTSIPNHESMNQMGNIIKLNGIKNELVICDFKEWFYGTV